MDGVEIRAASSSDASQLLPLVQAYWRHDGIAAYEPARLHRQLLEFLSTPAFGSAWLATKAGAVIGYLVCTLVYSFEHGGLMAEIDELFVSAEHRRRGVGQGLLARARTELCAHGCGALQLQVADGNRESQDFYSRLGFKEKSGYRLWLAPLRAIGAT